MKPIRDQLTQGIDPKSLAKTCAAGVSIAILPVIGATTALCVFVGIRFKLNQPILQAINYVLYPLQLLLLPLFLFWGAKLTGAEMISFDPKTISTEFLQSPTLFLGRYGMAGLHAVLIWIILVPFLFKFIEWVAYRVIKSKAAAS